MNPYNLLPSEPGLLVVKCAGNGHCYRVSRWVCCRFHRSLNGSVEKKEKRYFPTQVYPSCNDHKVEAIFVYLRSVAVSFARLVGNFTEVNIYNVLLF